MNEDFAIEHELVNAVVGCEPHAVIEFYDKHVAEWRFDLCVEVGIIGIAGNKGHLWTAYRKNAPAYTRYTVARSEDFSEFIQDLKSHCDKHNLFHTVYR